ncbi:MAG: hypothetical protein HY909_12740 [Deltaproteobacteria bacterium]|nr:hypothetical protein [Deltaproteobacteria bacterium]
MDATLAWLSVGAVQAVGALGVLSWRMARRAQERQERRVEDALQRALQAIDPEAGLVREARGDLQAELKVDGRPCELRVFALRAVVHCALRTMLPATAIAGLLKDTEDPLRVRTGDHGFDDRFAVTARSEGAARLLSTRVRGALVSLPRAMEAPRLVIETAVIELTWQGAHGEASLREALRVLLAVRNEFDERLPLR